MTTSKPNEHDVSLPFAALQLLAPPVRLVSAAVWKVMKQRDVLQYGVLEEFVTSACEAVPGLLTIRHQGKLALGLRARLILELCYNQPDVKLVEPHLRRIRTSDPSSSAPTAMKDAKVIKAAKKFDLLVHTLLSNPSKREQFFKEEFPLEYGPVFDQELEKLLWEFLIRLDQLLPVPNLAQTVSWLSGAPPVLEQCARAATQPQLLKTVLQHQSCLGHLEPAASLPQNMGDSILDSLSLPLSGRVASDESTQIRKCAVDKCTDGAQTTGNLRFITPVIGLIANEDVPCMISASKKTVTPINATNVFIDPKENLQIPIDDGKKGEKHMQKKTNSSRRSLKRKLYHPVQSQTDSDSDEEYESLGMAKSAQKSFTRVRQTTGDLRTDSTEVKETQTGKNEACNTSVLVTCMSKLGLKTLHLPEEPSLRSVYLSCLHSQPRVIVRKLPVAHQPGRKQQGGRRQSSVKPAARKPFNKRQNRDSDLPDWDNKENHPALAGVSSSPSHHLNNTDEQELPGDNEDYVADSEDEVTKNLKGRLFMKRYYRTRHGTYIPTLREFWKPAKMQRSSKRR
ncbi:TERF1-interacting nuclear factor 2 [Betta splendens]|uniref:TERF1-interacting nuclear factor 2 n=1 Tax=Betta splendens TaxID=158456 RepID=A0A6P7P9U9_BETSP|nr:TERF1-interacting nuclear factor 2 [Betta splendens]